MSQIQGERKENCTCEAEKPENLITNVHYYLLASTGILAIFNLLLILIVIIGYCRFLRRRKIPGNNESIGTDSRKKISDTQTKPSGTLLRENSRNSSSMVDLPTKMRKRSMAFSETDEECRRYRESFSDPCVPTTEVGVDKGEEGSDEGEKTFRKKSVVTFVGVEEEK